jgi:predicted nucleotidyltransferase
MGITALEFFIPDSCAIITAAMSIMKKYSIYAPLIDSLKKAFGNSFKTVVLFGSKARKQAKEASDHDIFLIIKNLSSRPLERQKQIRTAILDIPLRVNTIAKTPEEFEKNLTPLILEICVDGICLYGEDYFEPYRKKALDALKCSRLKRKRVGQEWYWHFDRIPEKEWELTWEGFRELP